MDAPPDEDGAAARSEFEAIITGGENVAIRNFMDPDCDYYIVQLDADPWMTVPAGGTLISHGLWGDDGENLSFGGGTRVLHVRLRHVELVHIEFS